MSDGIDWRSGEAQPERKLVSPFLNSALAGKVVLISGGGSGIGLAIAQQCGLHGASVAIMGRKAERLEAATLFLRSNGINDVLPCVGDVRHAEQGEKVVAAVLARFGRLDVLVNCAAGNFLCLAEDLSPNAFKTVVDIDLLGTFNMSKAAFKPLKTSKGSIINITATLHYGATPLVIHAAAAKAGVDALTRGLAVEWSEYGIRVNGIAPGPIKDTEGFDRLVPSGSSPVPVGEKDDIALAVVYLCSSAAKYVNGDTLVVDGAAWMIKGPMVSRETYNKYIKNKSKL